MKIYRDITELHLAHQGVKKWNRAFQAIAKFELIPANQSHSIVDSLTYLITTTDRHSPDNDFVGHRRYFEAIFALDGDVSIEVSPKADLLQSVPYSDLTDREHFTGSGQDLTLRKGEVLVTDIDEALRLSKDATARIAIMRITIEGASFHNK